MDYRKQIKEEFGVDLPIKNGLGTSFETAVIIELNMPGSEYVHIQQEYLKYMGLLRNIEWKKISQALEKHNNKTYDLIKIETTGRSGKIIITTLETHYFEITEVLNTHLSDWLSKIGQ